MTYLLAISGSLRKGSYNTQLAAEAGRMFGGEVRWGDLRMPLYDGDLEAESGPPARASALAEAIAGAKAALIASPEYNQSFSGVLKNALDWVSRIPGAPWKDKPVAIVSAAAGRAGGARAQYALRLALNPFRPRLITGPEVLLANPAAAFDANGRLIEESYRSRLEELMSQLREG